MQLAREHFLARAGLAQHQHRDAGIENATRALEIRHLRVVEQRRVRIQGRRRRGHGDRRGRACPPRARGFVHVAVEHPPIAVVQRPVVAQARDRAVEQRVVRRAAQVGAFQAEQRQAHAVGGDQAPVAERQQPFARGAEQRALAMDAQQVRIGDAFVEVAVLDVRHRQLRQPQRMHLRHRRVAGDVQHADHASVGIEDGRGRAVEDAVRGRVMLAAAHFHRAGVGDGGTDGVGAHPRLAPAGARHQRHATGLVQKSRAALGIQDPALGIGEDRDAAGVGRIGGQHLHLRPRQPPQPLVLLAHGAQAGRIDGFDRGPGIRCQAQAAAASPRLQDRTGDLAHRRAPGFEECAPRLDDRVAALEVLCTCHRPDPAGDVSHFATARPPAVPIHTTARDTVQSPLMLRRGSHGAPSFSSPAFSPWRTAAHLVGTRPASEGRTRTGSTFPRSHR